MSTVVDAPDREVVRRRLRAARMLADFTNPARLAEQPLCQANGITESLIVDTERKARDALPMELETIAEACGLPRQWFTASFDLLADDSEIRARMSLLEDQLGEIRDLVAADATREAITASRAVTRAAQVRAVGDDSETRAAGDTRDSADASQERDQPRREAKP